MNYSLETIGNQLQNISFVLAYILNIFLTGNVKVAASRQLIANLIGKSKLA